MKNYESDKKNLLQNLIMGEFVKYSNRPIRDETGLDVELKYIFKLRLQVFHFLWIPEVVSCPLSLKAHYSLFNNEKFKHQFSEFVHVCKIWNLVKVRTS